MGGRAQRCGARRLPDRFRPLTKIPQAEGEDWDPETDEPDITLAFWNTGDGWQHGDPDLDSDGDVPATWMFHLLAGDFTAEGIAQDYCRYFQIDIDVAALQPFLDLQPLTRDRVLAVHPTPDWDAVARIADYGGYPSELDLPVDQRES